MSNPAHFVTIKTNARTVKALSAITSFYEAEKVASEGTQRFAREGRRVIAEIKAAQKKETE